MKYICLLFFIVAVSCSQPRRDSLPELSIADSLIQVGRADSAQILLENLPTDSLFSSASRAYYALLLTQARDKNYVAHTNDSLMRMAVGYYDSIADKAYQAKAHYYLGRVYQDMDNVDGTVSEFLTALPLAKEAQDISLTCLLYGNLGYIHWIHGLLNEADSLYKEEICLTEQYHDTLHWAVALSMRGDICMERGNKYYAEAEKCLQQALVLVENVSEKDIFVERKVINSLGYLYERIPKLPEALSFINRHIAFQLEPDALNQSYLLLGSVYYQMEKYDSAKIYINKCLLSSNYGIKGGAYMRLADIARAEGFNTDALLYDNHSMVCLDSVRRTERAVEITALSKDLLHQQTLEKHASVFSTYRYAIYVVGGLLLIMIVCYLYKHKCAKQEVLRLQGEHQTLVSQLKQSQFQTEDDLRKISSLEQEYKACNNDREKLLQINLALEELLKEKDKFCLQQTARLIESEAKIQELSKEDFEVLIRKTSIYHTLLDLIKTNKENPDLKRKLEDDEWKTLEIEIQKLLPQFIDNLKHQLMCLQENDIHFCCLIRLGFNKSEIQYIYSLTLDAIYKHEKAMRKRMKLADTVKFPDILNNL